MCADELGDLINSNIVESVTLHRNSINGSPEIMVRLGSQFGLKPMVYFSGRTFGEAIENLLRNSNQLTTDKKLPKDCFDNYVANLGIGVK